MLRRTSPPNVVVETRNDGTPVIRGYAAVFHRKNDPGTEYRIGKHFVERIDRRAFDRAISEGDDVRALYNHDASRVMARTKNGTLRLTTDDTGLRYELEPGNTSWAADALEAIRRGDIDGSSFGFSIRSSQWIEGEEDDDPDIRVIRDVELYEVSPVTFPAYTATSAGVRSTESDEEEATKSYEQWKARQKRLEEIRNDR